MRFIEDRISVICNELKELAFVKKEPVKGVVYKKGLYFYPYEAEQSAEPWEEFDSKTMHWYGPDEHYWFRAEYTVPKSMDGKNSLSQGGNTGRPLGLRKKSTIFCCL